VNNNSAKYSRINSFAIILGVALSAGRSPRADAGDFAYGLGYTGTSSSNVTRVPVNERHEWINSILGGFTYVENNADVTTRLFSQVEYVDYRNKVYGNETLANMSANAVWTISPQQFTWMFDDTYQQLQINATAASTPDNRTNVNVLSTGPDVNIRFTPVSSLALGARYGNVYTGRIDASNNRTSGYTSFLYQSTATTTYSLNYEVLRVNYDNDVLNTNYTRQDMFFRARVQPSRSEFVLDLGVTDINRDHGQDLNGDLARFSWIRQLTPESTLSLVLTSEFSDVGTDILSASTTANTPHTLGQSAPVLASVSMPSVAQTTASGDMYRAKHGEMNYTQHGSQVGALFQIFKHEYNYEVTPVDRTETGGHFELGYFFSIDSTASLFSDYTRTEYLNIVRNDKDKDSGLRYSHLITRNVTIGMEGRHTVRTSTIPTFNFIDNRVLLSVMYTSGPLYKPLIGR